MTNGTSALKNQSQPRPQLRVIEGGLSGKPKMFRAKGFLQDDTEFDFGVMKAGKAFTVHAQDCGDYTRDTVALRDGKLFRIASAKVAHTSSLWWVCKRNVGGA